MSFEDHLRVSLDEQEQWWIKNIVAETIGSDMVDFQKPAHEAVQKLIDELKKYRDHGYRTLGGAKEQGETQIGR